MSEDTVDNIKKLTRQEFKYQRLADAARNAQDSVGILANVIHELIGLVRDKDPEVAFYAERCLSRTPLSTKDANYAKSGRRVSLCDGPPNVPVALQGRGDRTRE